MAVHIKENKPIQYLAPLLKIVSDNHIPCVERLWKCESGKCFDKTTGKCKMTTHYTWELPAGNEWFVCSECGAQIHFDGPDDREIDMLEPELQKIARKDYKEYQRRLDERVRKSLDKHREDLRESRRRRSSESDRETDE
jgi:hypothetical protein